MAKLELIRNFCIIAHIDHGKSTLADRLLELTGTVAARDLQEQLLDGMDLERERGITIKSHPVRMHYKHEDGNTYELNLIDTPGHVDFAYEVSRSLGACEGAILLIDATQGVQAQTVANVNLAIRQNLKIIPVINKIDLPASNLPLCYEQMEEILALPREEALSVSGKTGEGVPELLRAVIERIPHPVLLDERGASALIFDSNYDAYRGVVNYVRVKNGSFKRGTKIRLFNNGIESEVKEVGFFGPEMRADEELAAGSVGYLIPNLKSPADTKMGDTITDIKDPCDKPLPGFKEVRPMVFSGIYPIDTADYEQLKASMAKLQLNDAAFMYQAETSAALGFGFRCGFLGLLHMEIIQERLYREFDMDVITTVSNVSYRITTTQGDVVEVHNPSGLPEVTKIAKIEEPYILAQIITKAEFLGNVIKLCIDKRGVMKNQTFITQDRVEVNFDMPLSEIVFDFYDKLKSISKGYASFDYHRTGYQPSKLVKLDILLNGEPVDALSSLTYTDHAYDFGRKMCEKLKELIPRQQFDIAIQAAIGAKIIARETVKAVRKDVTAKCYGGDISRKRKLLEKQKKGKKRMRQIGNVEVPQSAFLAVLKMD